MIKRITCALLCIIFVFLLIGCGTALDSADKESEHLSQFVKVEDHNSYFIAYHRETKVMYAVSYKNGNFTVLVDPDGSPMIWDGD